MSRRQYSPSKRIAVAAAVALCAAGAAMADDSSMSRFGGDSYAYFNSQPIDKSPSTWRQANPHGLTERELQALSSSDLSVFTSRLNPPVLASAPADPTWRQSHPHGLTERELQALSSSSLAAWQDTDRSAGLANVAEGPSRETPFARMKKFVNAGSGTQAGTYQ